MDVGDGVQQAFDGLGPSMAEEDVVGLSDRKGRKEKKAHQGVTVVKKRRAAKGFAVMVDEAQLHLAPPYVPTYLTASCPPSK